MKAKFLHKTFSALLSIAIFMAAHRSCAQNKADLALKRPKQSYADSLAGVISNAIYTTYYDSSIRAKVFMPTYTILKIDIDKEGKLVNMQFSDTADSLFKQVFISKKNYARYKPVIEAYANAKSYASFSILIPVIYWANYDLKKSITLYDPDLLMQYNNKAFSGKSIMFAPVRIGMLSRGNM